MLGSCNNTPAFPISKWSRVDKVTNDRIAIEDTDNGEQSFDDSKDNVTDMNISVTIANDTSNEKALLMEEEIDREDLLIKDTNLSEDDRPLVRDTEVLTSRNENKFLHSDVDTKSSAMNESLVRKKMPSEIPPKSVVDINRMNQILARHFRSPHSMKPQWATLPPDIEVLDAKEKITSAHIPPNSPLFSPLFRNMSMFMRSYELMERMLKVYIYKDGEKPIFHQPTLEGLYASEGWFMLEENKHFVTKDPKKAHLFYMAFSSKTLAQKLHVLNSHNHSNLRQYMKEYTEKIAVKYPFWNRTGGMDHFLAACHDWAL